MQLAREALPALGKAGVRLYLVSIGMAEVRPLPGPAGLLCAAARLLWLEVRAST